MFRVVDSWLARARQRLPWSITVNRVCEWQIVQRQKINQKSGIIITKSLNRTN